MSSSSSTPPWLPLSMAGMGMGALRARSAARKRTGVRVRGATAPAQWARPGGALQAAGCQRSVAQDSHRSAHATRRRACVNPEPRPLRLPCTFAFSSGRRSCGPPLPASSLSSSPPTSLSCSSNSILPLSSCAWTSSCTWQGKRAGVRVRRRRAGGGPAVSAWTYVVRLQRQGGVGGCR